MADNFAESGEFEISEQEKIQIARHYLLSSPPGQFNDIYRDLQKIIPGVSLSDNFKSIAREYNILTKKFAMDDTKKVLITSEGQIDADHYIDSKNKQIVAVDHTNLQILPEDPVPLFDGAMDDSIEDFRLAIERSLEEYMISFYRSDFCSAVYGKNGKITIVVSGQHLNLRNFYSGQWSSKWEVEFNRNSAQCSGTIQIHAHYFEEGNVQLQTTKHIESQTFEASDPSSLAHNVVQMILNSENELQRGLEEMYINMKDETLKAMRRTMTIARTKFNWNISEHRLAKHMRK